MTKTLYVVRYNDKYGNGNNKKLEVIVKSYEDFLKWLDEHNKQRKFEDEDADGGEVDYEDEFVKGYIRIDADQNVEILDWNSKYKEKRGTENSLKSLREVYNGDIIAIDVGYDGEPSFSYWEKMLHKGLIDGFIDDNAIYHNKSKFKDGGEVDEHNKQRKFEDEDAIEEDEDEFTLIALSLFN